MNEEISRHEMGCMISEKEGKEVDIFLPMDKY
jgi:hypothetical protein